MDKKQQITGVIVTALVIVVFTSIAALLVSSVLSNSVFTDIPTTGTNTNETLTAVDDTANSSYAILVTQPTATCTLSTVYNATGGEVVAAGNYTAYTDCNLILIDAAYNATDLNVTYSYSYASGTSLAGFNATKASEGFGAFVTNLIAFLAVIGTILGVVWLVMYVRKLFDKKEGLQNISA